MVDLEFLKGVTMTFILFNASEIGGLKNRFNTGSHSGHNGTASCRRNGKECCIPNPMFVDFCLELITESGNKLTLGKSFPVKIGERTFLLSDLNRCLVSGVSHNIANIISHL